MSATQEEDTKHRLGGAHTNLKVKGQVNSFCAKIQVFYFSVVCKCDKAFVLPILASDEGLAFLFQIHFTTFTILVFFCILSLTYIGNVLMLKIRLIVSFCRTDLCLQDGNKVFYRINSSTQLKKLMDAYDFREHKQCKQIKMFSSTTENERNQ